MILSFFYSFFKSFFENIKIFKPTLLLILTVLRYLCFIKSKQTSDKKTTFFEKERFFLNNGNTYILDTFFLKPIFSKSTSKNNFFKVLQLNNNSFYLFNKGTTHQQNLYNVPRSFWKHLTFWFIPLILALAFFYFSFFLRSLPFVKLIFAYFLAGGLFYLLMSGFVFFFKKYQYRLYTTAIQRFWRRSLIIFWAIEGCLFVTFLYLILNANQEPVYVYDNVQVFKTHFYSWRFFLPKIISSTIMILFTYLLLLSLRWNTFTKSNNLVVVITVVFLYVLWLEFYQFFHLMNLYGTTNWVYDFTEHLWNLETEFKRTRIVNHYVTIGLVAKFWHVVFAAIFWFFFIFRGIESNRYRYPLLSANLQNFIIIYAMSWLYMYPWFKYVLRKSLDMTYFWFFLNNRKLAVYLFFNDIKLYSYSFFNPLLQKNNFFLKKIFFYFNETSTLSINTQFRKHNIKNLFIRNVSI